MNDDKNTNKQEEAAAGPDGNDRDLPEFEEVLKDLEGKYKRALADYQNLEKRVREEKVQWIKTASKDLLTRILPIVDTLLLAQKHSDEKTLTVVAQQFLDLLKDEGVVRIETTGKKFDPKLMECITVEQGNDGKVLEELRPGFMLHEIVLRPAQVKVGKKS